MTARTIHDFVASEYPTAAMFDALSHGNLDYVELTTDLTFTVESASWAIAWVQVPTSRRLRITAHGMCKSQALSAGTICAPQLKIYYGYPGTLLDRAQGQLYPSSTADRVMLTACAQHNQAGAGSVAYAVTVENLAYSAGGSLPGTMLCSNTAPAWLAVDDMGPVT